MTATGAPRGVSIRRAEREDLHDVSRIERDVFPQPWPRGAFEEFLGEPGFLVAVSDGATSGDDEEESVVGYVVADVVGNYGRRIGHVKDVAVAPAYRRRGVATALLDRALDTLAGQAVASVKLEVREHNESAHALYEQFGFRLRRRLPEYYADGEDALVFVTPLD